MSRNTANVAILYSARCSYTDSRSFKSDSAPVHFGQSRVVIGVFLAWVSELWRTKCRKIVPRVDVAVIYLYVF